MCDECTEQAWEMSAEDERERIIKLLESKLQHDRLAEIDKSAATMNLQIRLMVELIKGGNK